ncbi:hypothetical protein CsSME_00030270 [Camellia sinensis var. sinensis]
MSLGFLIEEIDFLKVDPPLFEADHKEEANPVMELAVRFVERIIILLLIVGIEWICNFNLPSLTNPHPHNTSDHITYDLHHLNSYQPYHGNDHVTIGNDTSLPIHNTGQVLKVIGLQTFF